FRDAVVVLVRYLAPEDVPVAVRDHIARGSVGALPETVKPGNPALARAATVVIGGNRDAVAGAAPAARARGYAAEVVAEPLGGRAASTRQPRSPRPTATRCSTRPATSSAPDPRAPTSPIWWWRSAPRAKSAQRSADPGRQRLRALRLLSGGGRARRPPAALRAP